MLMIMSDVMFLLLLLLLFSCFALCSSGECVSHLVARPVGG